ncbi:beta-ketothiolase BktB [Pseudomonas lalucatii]|uniref:Beta-ketothiolase BktB n=1 Tax=Pseudomonas lalucatii TaxID=1424203 RepID=A0ABS5Q3I4_9PSED|nr:beta-ketothiolase BktB [Pseudomonas lalucatii]MBS7663277.1 beta-ketothiolase BktB [Pseudomonas lalucatii]MBS7724937.1 beta-ketothiolase BktB [Pseudomonas lalucatii]
MLNPVFILSGVRTAIGDYGGALKDLAPCDLASQVVQEAIRRSGLPAELFEQCVLGNVLHSEARDMYISRVAALNAGMAQGSRALTLNRLCGSGLQAVISAAQMIQLGDVVSAVAGGAESMSRAGYLLPSNRWGKRMGDSLLIDMLTGVLTDPFGNGHMGVTAENVGRSFGIARAEQDALALESHRRAARASAEGRFDEQILPLQTHPKKPEQLFRRDEHVREHLQLGDLAKARPVFESDGTVTAGNASSLNDGAAALTLVSGALLEQRGLTPMARIVAYGHAGVAPEIMGMGPVGAVQQALQRAQLSLADIDVVESNEAFAAQACAVSQALKIPAEKVNPNGGAIALGHPIGATGAIILIKAIYELQRTGGRYALVTMCIGGGQGIALIVERE